MSQNDALPSFDELLDFARKSAYHLETRDAYGVAYEVPSSEHGLDTPAEHVPR